MTDQTADDSTAMSAGPTAQEPTTVGPGLETGRGAGGVISVESQHVIDSLEAHYNAVLEAVKHGTPGTIKAVQDGMVSLLARVDRWGVAFRGDLEQMAAKWRAAKQAAATPVGGGVVSADGEAEAEGSGDGSSTPAEAEPQADGSSAT